MPDTSQPLLPTSTCAAHKGDFTLILGCMFSGKTTELLDRVSRVPQASLQVFKHVIDDRYGRCSVQTHTGQRVSAEPVSSAGELHARLQHGVQTVAVDEAHFFDAAIVQLLRDLTERGVDVIATALDRNSWGRPFEVVEWLRTYVRGPIVLHAPCAQCGRASEYTQRLTPIVDGKLVGGPEAYEPRCAVCWHPPAESPPVE